MNVLEMVIQWTEMDSAEYDSPIKYILNVKAAQVEGSSYSVLEI